MGYVSSFLASSKMFCFALPLTNKIINALLMIKDKFIVILGRKGLPCDDVLNIL